MIPPPVTDKIIYQHFNLGMASMNTKQNNNDWNCLIQHPFTIYVWHRNMRLDRKIHIVKILKHTLMLVGWLCLTSHRQRGHLETAPPFTVPCEGREAR